MNSQRVTVVDLGSSKTACLVAECDAGGEMTVVATSTVSSKGLQKGAIVDIEEAVRGVDAAVRGVQNSTGEDVQRVVISVGGRGVEGVSARGYVPIYPSSRQITREDVLQVIKHSRQVSLPPDREQIQAMPCSFAIDGEKGVTRPIGRTGSKLEVVTFLVTGDASHIQNVERTVALTGRSVDQMVLQSLASGLGVLKTEELDAGVAVVDLGGGSTDVAVFKGGAIAFCATLPVGGQLVTSDLSKLLKTSPEEAERLKTEFAAATLDGVLETDTVPVLQLGQAQARPLARRVLCEIVQSRMREIATMARQQIEKSGLSGELPGGVIVTGGGSLLTGTVAVFEDAMPGVKVRLGRPTDSGIKMRGADDPALATAVGLARFALQSFDDEFVPIGGADDWKDRIRTFWSLLSGRA